MSTTNTNTNSNTKPQTFQIHYFSTASSYTHRQTESLPAPCPLHKLFDLLEARYPGIKEKVLVSCAVSVGLEYVDVDGGDVGDVDGEMGMRMIGAGEEVAIIPPVSSG
ncbi:hypothetical protein FQN55_006479 [Onygenales sp. PD_40]|nr:hypothetical protein FQN55_006479 [Onygenales sp. PD_40]KAK2781662.1 hypothetical protein FQN53_000453 [Emmonsiellopsis sp. PD_33]